MKEMILIPLAKLVVFEHVGSVPEQVESDVNVDPPLGGSQSAVNRYIE